MYYPFALLCTRVGDDVLDYREAVAKLPNVQTVIEEGGTHPFERIVAFLRRKSEKNILNKNGVTLQIIRVKIREVMM